MIKIMIRKAIQFKNRPVCNLGQSTSACVSALAGLFIKDNKMKTIPLTQGQFALVDDEDFEWLNKWKWYAHKDCYGYYAERKCHCLDKKQHTIVMSRQIMSCPQTMLVDHKNHNTLDNQKVNLRICTKSENNHNCNKPKNNTSGYKGVSWDKNTKKWEVNIKSNGNQRYLGRFSNKIRAAKLYNKTAKELFGDFVMPNKI